MNPTENSTLNVPIGVASERSEFLVRVYSHLFGAIMAFIVIEWALFQSGIAETMARAMLSVSWLFVLGAFMVVSWLATRFAHNSTSQGMQYVGLGMYVVAMAVLMVPMLYVANAYFPGTISAAGGLTAVAFAVLTGIVFITRKSFSFLRPFLMFGGIVAIIAIVVGGIFGFNLGLWFFSRNADPLRRGDLVRHQQYPAALPVRSTRSRIAAALRLGHHDVLVHPPHSHVSRLTR